MKYKLMMEGGCWDFDTLKRIKKKKKLLKKYGFKVLYGKAACRAKGEQHKSTDGKMIKYRIRGNPVISIKTIKQLNKIKKT